MNEYTIGKVYLRIVLHSVSCIIIMFELHCIYYMESIFVIVFLILYLYFLISLTVSLFIIVFHILRSPIL
jgi:hypothetical protein